MSLPDTPTPAPGPSPTSGAPRRSVDPLLLVRGAVGGTLMGLANLVPGISGGTMLLAAGVYPGFIAAIAEVTTLRFRPRPLALLASIVASAALAILLLAGAMRALVEEQRWAMYSLFIGLTLGGVPLVWRMARPASTGLLLGAMGGFAAMLAMALWGAGAGAGGGGDTALVFFSGLAAASAMILPGVSGGYLLLLLGQYESILGTIDQLKRGLLAAGGPDWGLVTGTLSVVIPLGLGVAAGVIGVSNVLRWLLARYAKPTLGALLGLLFGAIVGLWPFQEPRPPRPGDVIEGRLVTPSNADAFDRDDWPLRSFQPSAGRSAAALGLMLLGLGATVAIGRLGGDAPLREEPGPAAPQRGA